MSLNQGELKCTSCIEWYDEGAKIPKELPCRHNVCASCVMKLVGEPVYGQGNQEPSIPYGRVLQCPVCRYEVRTEGINTNRALASKIGAMMGMESMLISNEDFLKSQTPKSKPSNPKSEQDLSKTHPQPPYPQPSQSQPLYPQPSQPPPPYAQPSQPQPSQPHPSVPRSPQTPQPYPHQPGAPPIEPGGQGLGWAQPTSQAPPDMPVTQMGDQNQFGWSVPGVPQGQQSPTDGSFQTMPQPFGGPPDFTPPSNYFPQQ